MPSVPPREVNMIDKIENASLSDDIDDDRDIAAHRSRSSSRMAAEGERNNLCMISSEQNRLIHKNNCNKQIIPVPCGMISTRPDYFTVPAICEMEEYKNMDGTYSVKGFTVGRIGYGNVYFPDAMDISNLNLDNIIFFNRGEVVLYPDDYLNKPPVGYGLNRRAQITLDRVFPKVHGKDVRDLQILSKLRYVENLKLSCLRQGCEFIEYRFDTGSWVFEVDHFSRYRVDFDDEDDGTASSTSMRVEKRPAKEDKPPAVEPKKLVFEEEDKNISQEEEISHGLGGFDFSVQDATSVLDLSTKVHQEEIRPRKNIELLRQALYGSEHVMDEDSPDDSHHTMDNNDVMSMDFSPLTEEQLVEAEVSPYSKSNFYTSPKISILQNVSGRVPPEKSLLRGLRSCIDMNIFRGRAFRCGWMKGFKHFSIGEEIYLGRHTSSILQIRDIETCNDSANNFIIPALNIVSSESEIEIDEKSNCPTFKININTSYLSKQTELFESFVDSAEYDEEMKYFSSIWKLCFALWAPLVNDKDLRKDYVSKWLRETVQKQIVDPWLITHGMSMSFQDLTKTVLELLSINNIDDAAEVLMLNKCPQLSMLVSQLTGTNYFENFLTEQLIHWNNSMAEEFIPNEMKKLYLLLSGNAVFGPINLCENLDWKRAFGIHLWYVAPSHAPVHEAIRIYKEAFDSEDAYTVKPLPPYAGVDADPNTYDILYHILTLYCSRVYVLNHVLNPATHTSDPLDYRTSWLLLQLFRSLQVGVVDELCENRITISLAHQLENMNEWQWAIFVLLFLKDNDLKKKRVIEILERNLSLEIDEETEEIDDTLVNKMKVPAQWIHEVKAYKAEHFEQHWLSFAHFAYAGNYYKSNDIFVTHLLPELVVNEHFDELKEAIKPLEPYCNDISSWCYEIGLILDFLELQDKFDDVEDNEDLLKLHTALVTLVKRLPRFPLNNDMQKLCIAEVSRKCALLQRILVEKVKDPLFKHTFIQVLDHLVMPPDYVFTEGLYYFLKLMK